MTAVHWSPNLSVGSEEIDSEHAELIDLLNSLAADVEAGAERESTLEGLDRLISGTEQHFRHEEEIMAREDYPDLYYHRRIHQALMNEIRNFRGDSEDGMKIGPEVTDFIRTWLINHIIESDKQLGGYLQGRVTAQSRSKAAG
jgi:hemerythrin